MAKVDVSVKVDLKDVLTGVRKARLSDKGKKNDRPVTTTGQKDLEPRAS